MAEKKKVSVADAYKSAISDKDMEDPITGKDFFYVPVVSEAKDANGKKIYKKVTKFKGENPSSDFRSINGALHKKISTAQFLSTEAENTYNLLTNNPEFKKESPEMQKLILDAFLNKYRDTNKEVAYVKKEKDGSYSYVPGKSVWLIKGTTATEPGSVAKALGHEGGELKVIKDLIVKNKKTVFDDAQSPYVGWERIDPNSIEMKRTILNKEPYVLEMEEKKLTKDQQEAVRRSAKRQIAKRMKQDFIDSLKKDKRLFVGNPEPTEKS